MTVHHIVLRLLYRMLRIVSLSIIHVISGKVRVFNLENLGATVLINLIGQKFAREATDRLSALK